MNNDEIEGQPKKYWIGRDKPQIEVSYYIATDYGKLSEQELIMRGIELDNHYERWDLDNEPTDQQQGNSQAD